MFFLSIIPFFILLIVLIAGIYGIVASRRRNETADPGIGTIRRLYFYIVSLVALMMAANGVVFIIQFVLEGLFESDVVSASSLRLALGLSLTLVGLPLWVFHWRFVQRYVEELPVEKRSLLRKFYIYVVMGVAAALFINSAVEWLKWIFQTGDFSGYHWGAIIIWGVVWAFHWMSERKEGQPTDDTLGIRRLYLYLVSLVALVMLALGLGRVVYLVLLEGYNALVSVPVLVPAGGGLGQPAIRTALAVAIVGGAVWAAHWLYFAGRDYGSTLRQVYLYIFAVLGGVVTILISLGIMLFGTLMWLFGGVVDDTAAMHFRFMPGAIASLSAGIALWAYHWLVVQREAEDYLFESEAARRYYSYILTTIGLGASAVAVFTLVSAFLGIVVATIGDLIVGRNLWQQPIATTITLGVLGLPLWAYYWRWAQAQVDQRGDDERITLPRRMFIFAALGAGVLALLGSVSSLLFIVLRDILELGVDLQTLRDAITPLGIIVAAAVFLPYYWGVYKQDREATTDETAEILVRKDVTVLVDDSGSVFVNQLEAALGYRVSTLRWADPDATHLAMSAEQCSQLAAEITEASGPRVLLIPDGAGVKVVSYS